MTTTITVDEAGRIHLPDSVQRLFGAKPGLRLRAEVTEERIEIIKEAPVVMEGVMERGVLVLPRLGINMDAATAVRADREDQSERARGA